ncbi:MAG TPA: NAD(P)/FAD-dependent oxidoreductase [Acidobacteriaceae bacterium]|jgi:protoporphyrinogen oxidase|nr:NAD(P)/FAD-dependent oxidoreductase [Acidobacteriaceae bacterium]
MARVVVIGAGAMGLAAAFRAAKNGHHVDLIEAAPEPGGMAGHFDFDGLSLERFYHFVCHTDEPTFTLLNELGLGSAMRWRPTSMGIYTGGALYPWGDPVALLKFPHLSPLQKIRYGLFALVSVRRNRWPAIEHESAKDWIIRWCGQGVYHRLWQPLFDYKFYEYANNISAAWIWTRIRRIGRSRRSMMQEELGYIEGGSLTLVNALVDAIQKYGGRLHLGEPALEVASENGRVTGVRTAAAFYPADAVICTSPTPLISALVPSLPQEWKHRYEAIHNIGVICVIFKLRRPVTQHFWVNISEPGIEIPGIIEFSNLRAIGGDAIVYVPYYMPVTHPKFSWPEPDLLNEAFACLQRLNPSLTRDDILATKVARLRYGQPVCEPGFAQKIPPVQTPIAGLQIADTCFYYPEDRGIAESVRLGQQMASAVDAS